MTFRLPDDCPAIHPVQMRHRPDRNPQLRKEVVVRAYEVYSHIYAPQGAMMSAAKGCRGGFSVGEIVGFLYARSFPQAEWRQRFEEACKDMQL